MQQRQFLINISNLPSQQKKHCTELLYNHDIVFQQQNQEFTARIVIDPNVKKSVHVKNKQTEPKKNISEVVSMDSFKHLIPLMKTVQVYVCPKKMSIQKLQSQLELMYQHFFKSNDIDTLITHNLKGAESFPQFFFNFLSKSQSNKIKFQQNYVNIIESINHFKTKYKGVKVFEQFLSKQYGLEEMLFFYFLRKMIETLRAVILVSKNKLKVSLYNMVLEQEHILTILESYLAHNHHQVFQEIKKHMNHDQKRKKNVIGVYQFIYILLDNFNTRQESVDMRQQLLKSLNTSFSRQSLIETQNKQTQSRFVFSPQQNLILLGCLQALQKICMKIKPTETFYDTFSEWIVKLLVCVFNGDKLGWFEEIRLEPTNARLHYFETLQQDYQQYDISKKESNLLLNRLIRRLMQAPGLQECYAKLILSHS